MKHQITFNDPMFRFTSDIEYNPYYLNTIEFGGRRIDLKLTDINLAEEENVHIVINSGYEPTVKIYIGKQVIKGHIPYHLVGKTCEFYVEYD